MRFVLDGRYIQDHFPGIGRYAFNLALALARVAPEEKFRVLYDPRLANSRFDLGSLAQFPNVELVRVNAPTFSLREQALGADHAAAGGAALWHSVYYLKPYLLPLPSVVTLEDVIPLIVPQEMPGAARRLLYRGLNLLAVRTAARLITLSPAARADIVWCLGAAPDKIAVVPLAADDRFQPVSPAESARVRAELGLPEVYALYVGSNKPHKNLVRLVQAWARVPTAAALVIAGNWEARYPQARIKAEELQLGERVLFRPDVPDENLPALVAGARVFVFPSTHEGFGLPPLEALACGTPVACANTSSLPEVVGDAALLFDPLDAGAIAAALACVLDDAELRDQLRAKGLAQARRFSWERTARETLAIYRAVVGE